MLGSRGGSSGLCKSDIEWGIPVIAFISWGGYISPQRQHYAQKQVSLFIKVMALNLVWSAAILAVAAIAIGAAIRVVLSSLRSKDYPPGPPTFPIIGNLHQIPLKKPFLKFHEWADTYGDIIGLKVGPANLVIIHSPELVRELFDKRGPAYSGRPYSYIPNEHVLGEHVDKHIISLQHGPVLRRWRSAVAPLLGPTGLRQTLPMQEATAAILLQQLLMSTSSDLFEHFRHWALATPLLAIAGQRLERHDKDFSDRYFNAQHLWLQLLEPGNAPPVDFLPFLRWVPECYADWKTKARTVREFMREEYSSFLRTAQSLCTVTGGPTDFKCLMTKLIEEDPEKKKGAQPFTPEEVAYLGGGLIDAAVDTTYATVMSFLLFIAAHPAIQAKARDEIDRVSADKPPSGDNIAQLPYLRACLLEVSILLPFRDRRFSTA